MTSRIALATLAVVACAAPAAAQQAGAPRAELRLDATDGRPGAVQLLAGAVIPAGNYVRVTIASGGGVARGTGGGSATGSARAEATARFLLDPYRESRIGLSAGGGVTVRHEPRVGTRAFLALLLDVEGRPRGRWAPALQLGLGGGARLGVAVRTLPPRRR